MSVKSGFASLQKDEVGGTAASKGVSSARSAIDLLGSSFLPDAHSLEHPVGCFTRKS